MRCKICNAKNPELMGLDGTYVCVECWRKELDGEKVTSLDGKIIEENVRLRWACKTIVKDAQDENFSETTRLAMILNIASAVIEEE